MSEHRTVDLCLYGPGGPDLPHAACRGIHQPLWDDRVHGESETERHIRYRAAMNICRGCPEQVRCREERDSDPSLPEGIWGGLLFTHLGARTVADRCAVCDARLGPRQTLYCSPTCRQQGQTRTYRKSTVHVRRGEG